MDSFNTSDRVLVTGANGHVAQHVVSQLLSLPSPERPRVRATVRAQKSASGLESVFVEAIDSRNLEIVFVPDIAQDSAFDQVVVGCTHIAHIASPLVVGAEDVERDVLRPAISGTTGLLRSAAKVDGLRAVVITSSFAAVHDPMYGERPGYTYTPRDWNPISYETAADPTIDLSVWPKSYQHFITYLASKKFAESSAWDLYEKLKPSWTLSAINPTYIGGPNILPLTRGADSLSFSQKLILNVAQSKPGDELADVDFPNWVDVRDVAKAHIRALLCPEAKGKRFILAPYKVAYSDMATVLRKKRNIQCSDKRQELNHFDVDSSDCRSILGITTWVPFEDLVCDTVDRVREQI